MDHDASGEARTADGPTSTGPTASLLDGLAHAMHAALRRQRERIDDIVASDAREQTEKTRARAALEAAELRRMADDEVREIEAWKAREIKRIRREAARRSKERRADMASYLLRHDAIIDSEIAGVETAVAAYSAELARFVEDLSATGDPGEMARLADTVPTPPDMREVLALARARAVAAHDMIDDAPDAMGASPVDVEPAIPAASEPASDPGVAVMDLEADGRPDNMPLPVDPLQVPEDEPVGAGEPPMPDEEATEASGRPTGAFRFFRALVPWSAASDGPPGKDREARS
jgi:hypothetical protein